MRLHWLRSFCPNWCLCEGPTGTFCVLPQIDQPLYGRASTGLTWTSRLASCWSCGPRTPMSTSKAGCTSRWQHLTGFHDDHCASGKKWQRILHFYSSWKKQFLAIHSRMHGLKILKNKIEFFYSILGSSKNNSPFLFCIKTNSLTLKHFSFSFDAWRQDSIENILMLAFFRFKNDFVEVLQFQWDTWNQNLTQTRREFDLLLSLCCLILRVNKVLILLKVL